MSSLEKKEHKKKYMKILKISYMRVQEATCSVTYTCKLFK